MALKIAIVIEDDDQAALLESTALENKLTADEYAANIVTGWLENQLRGKYIAVAKTATLSDLKSTLTTLKEKLVSEKVLEV